MLKEKQTIYDNGKIEKFLKFRDEILKDYSLSEKKRIGKQWWQEHYFGDGLLLFEKKSEGWIEKDINDFIFLDEFNEIVVDEEKLDNYIDKVKNPIIGISYSCYDFTTILPLNNQGYNKYGIRNFLTSYEGEIRNPEFWFKKWNYNDVYVVVLEKMKIEGNILNIWYDVEIVESLSKKEKFDKKDVDQIKIKKIIKVNFKEDKIE